MTKQVRQKSISKLYASLTLAEGEIVWEDRQMFIISFFIMFSEEEESESLLFEIKQIECVMSHRVGGKQMLIMHTLNFTKLNK